MRYEFIKTDPAVSGHALEVLRPEGSLPIRSFRDFYAFEQHVKAARARRGAEMIPEWYDLPVFYFSNAFAFLTNGDKLVMPQHDEKLDFELELGAVIGKQLRDASPEEAE